MIAEVANALLLTYLATEYGSFFEGGGGGSKLHRYHYDEDDDDDDKKRKRREKMRKIAMVVALVFFINLCDEITGIGAVSHAVVDFFVILHLPKAVFAASVYVAALYFDCRSAFVQHGNTDHKTLNDFKANFLPRVIRLFLRILPVYPVAAVLISFGFMFVISLFELLHMPVDVLNWPIYYGTLYGPFSYIYCIVKRDVIQEQSRSTLPISR